MQISYTKNTLKKLELIFEELSFEIRYVKGHIQSGYCIVAKNRIILISKFFGTSARIESLLDILGQVEILEQNLSDNSKKFLSSLAKLKLAA